jgi:hypothetical protein
MLASESVDLCPEEIPREMREIRKILGSGSAFTRFELFA